MLVRKLGELLVELAVLHRPALAVLGLEHVVFGVMDDLFVASGRVRAGKRQKRQQCDESMHHATDARELGIATTSKIRRMTSTEQLPSEDVLTSPCNVRFYEVNAFGRAVG